MFPCGVGTLYRAYMMLNAKLYAMLDYRIQLKGRRLTLKMAPRLESQGLARTPPGSTPPPHTPGLSTPTTEASNSANDMDGDGLSATSLTTLYI